MAITLNPLNPLNNDGLERDGALPAGPDPRVQHGAPQDGTAGQLAVGRYVVGVGGPHGAAIRHGSRAERAHIRPRGTPVLLRPRLIRTLFDRQAEVAAALSAIDAGIPIEITGDAGIGKTALLRHLAHHQRSAAFADGVVYLQARHQSFVDLLQVLFEAFCESDEICKPTEAEIRRVLHDRQALILLDDVHLVQHELEQVLDVAPRSAFAVATRKRTLWGEVRNVHLQGLPVDDAVLFLEREIERPLDAAERPAAAALCAGLGGHPRRIQQAAAIVRERRMQVDAAVRLMGAGGPLPMLLASLDDKQRRVLLSLTALPGVPLPAQHVSGISETADLEPALLALTRQALLVNNSSRHQLAGGIGDQLRRIENLAPSINRAITYFTAWAERYRRSAPHLLDTAEALVRAQQSAADAHRWGEVLRLGRLLDGALVLGVRWGAWATVLERCLAAAKATKDRSAEAWALHQLGTRAVCLGEPARARALLSQAAAVRESLGDAAAAAISRQNLEFVQASIVEDPDDPSAGGDDDLLGDYLPPATAMYRPVRRTSSAAAPLTVLLLAVIAALVFLARADLAPQSWTAAATTAPADTAAPAPADLTPRPQEPLAAAPPVAPGDGPSAARAGILIFTARPGSIAVGGPTRLCYAVDNAVRVRIQPGIGEVSPASTLTCVRVAPSRTTTYELTAAGRDGQPVSQQVVIIVR